MKYTVEMLLGGKTCLYYLDRMRGCNVGIIDQKSYIRAVKMTSYGLTCMLQFIVVGTGVDRLCGLVVRVLGYRSGGPGSIPGTTRKKLVGLKRGPLSLLSTTEELLDRKIAAPV
jgi:hypothetical protein